MFGKDKENQSQRGMLAETAVLNRFVELGYEVLIPWGGYYAYDLAYVQSGKSGMLSSEPPELIRVQVKLARMSADGSYFEFHTSTKAYGGKRVSYGGKVEMFAVYCAETGKVYCCIPQYLRLNYPQVRAITMSLLPSASIPPPCPAFAQVTPSE